ncbi:hypothetical protein HanXRQr2_Chr11g0513571 [Helianthus annuus]|uniref:Uncharacterized protein n=1 Tax=Helianthus annuus TaxID=4232 RepID=A0A9K3HSW9_HELAN|nr:hypothetical protein HanXRQr2_Chr11g0513571 [Helianthus annuus]KAJ0876975.1 hypothetical protein HanPSC8_Chr11g0494841 [Helianthus annuus]
MLISHVKCRYCWFFPTYTRFITLFPYLILKSYESVSKRGYILCWIKPSELSDKDIWNGRVTFGSLC